MNCQSCNEGSTALCSGTPEQMNKVMDAGLHTLIQYNKDKETLSIAVHEIKESDLKPDDDPESIQSLLHEYFGLLKDEKKKSGELDDYIAEHTGGQAVEGENTGKCAMLNSDGTCMLDDLDLRVEGGQDWNSNYGKSIVEKWKHLNNYND